MSLYTKLKGRVDMSKMLKTNWSLEWTKDNAEVIVKALVALDIPTFGVTVDDPVGSQAEYKYLGESNNEACGVHSKEHNHFKHLENFLTWYFQPEKSYKQSDLDELKAQIDELRAKIDNLEMGYDELEGNS